MVQRSGDIGGWRRNRVESHLQTIPRRRSLDHPPWSKVVQPGPRWSRVVHSAERAAGRRVAGASRGIKPQLARTVRLGIPRRSRRVSGAARLSGALSEQWTTSARGGPEGWSRVVQCGPVWSSGSRRRGVEGAQRSIWAWCAKDAQGDSASITASLRRIGWLGADCSCVGRRPDCPFVRTVRSPHEENCVQFPRRGNPGGGRT